MHPGDDKCSDSGYGSTVGSPKGDKQSASTQAQPQTEPDQEPYSTNRPNRPKPIEVDGIKGLKRFEKKVDEAIIHCFQDVVERLEGPLFTYMCKQWRQSRPMAIRLMVLGKDEGDAKPWIVVLCTQDRSRRVQRFFQKKFAKAVYCPEGPAEHRFEVLVIGQPPKTKATSSSLEVYGGLLSPRLECIRVTSCGTLIKLAVQDDVRFATLGGIVKVVTSDGSYNLYGLTAGHILDPTEISIDSDHSDTTIDREEDMSSEEEDVDEVRSNTDVIEPSSDLIRELDLSLPSVPNKINIDGWSRLGTIPAGSRQIQDCNRDWTLIGGIESKFHRPNCLVGDVSKSQYRCKDLQEPSRTTLKSPKKVVLNSESFSRELKRGVLSNLPTMLMLPPGRKCVRVYPLSMDDGLGVFDANFVRLLLTSERQVYPTAIRVLG